MEQQKLSKPEISTSFKTWCSKFCLHVKSGKKSSVPTYVACTSEDSVLFFTADTPWEPTSTWRSCSRRSSRTCCAFCCVCDAGSTVSWMPSTGPLGPPVQTKAVALATRQSRDKWSTVSVFAAAAARGPCLRGRPTASLCIWAWASWNSRGACDPLPRWEKFVPNILSILKLFYLRWWFYPFHCQVQKVCSPNLWGSENWLYNHL